MKDCIFCDIVAGSLEAKKVYEDEEILAFEDIRPSTPVHVVVIPKKHVMANLAEANEDQMEILGKLQIVAGKIAKKLGVFEAFSYKTNSGSGAGQSVWHIHYHLQSNLEGGRK